MFIDAILWCVRYSVRVLLRNRGFTITAVLTLAAAIGASTSVFSAIDAILLRPLPFPDSGRLTLLMQSRQGGAETDISLGRLQDWDRLNTTFEAVTGFRTEDVSDTTSELPERVRRAFVAPRFIEVWGTAPALGRGFVDGEHHTGGPPAVLVSHRYWQQRLGSDPNVLRSSVRIGTEVYPIVGVMPASFAFPESAVDLWFPAILDSPLALVPQARQFAWYTAVGRLRRNATLEHARADLNVVQSQLAIQYPGSDAGLEARVAPLKDRLVGGAENSLWLLSAAVAVLVVVACTNIAALFLARATQQEREIGLRVSLGASPAAVAALVLTEAGVLAFAGAVLGLLLASATPAVLRVLAPDLPRLAEVGMSWSVVLYALLSCVFVALLCGLWPAIRSARHTASLIHADRSQVSGHHSVQWTLVATQVAFSVLLLSAAGLLVRSFDELSRVTPGFELDGLLTLRVSGEFTETGDRVRLQQRVENLIDELDSVPGVQSVATSAMAPGVPGQAPAELQVAEGLPGRDARISVESRYVSPSYFATLGIPQSAGESCRSQPFGGAVELMVNRRFAQEFFGDRSPLGFTLTGFIGAPSGRIVGVVGDARELGVNRDPVPTVYVCYTAPNPSPLILIRTGEDPLALAPALRRKVLEVEPLRSVYEIATLETVIGDAFAQNRLRTVLLTSFAMAAVLLAGLGVYGTLSYIVSTRRREIGLRLALGARKTNIASHFLLKVLRTVGISCAVGLALTFAFTRSLAAMLYGVSPSDPMTLASAVVLIVAVASVAALVPVMRAAIVEPMKVLRDE